MTRMRSTCVLILFFLTVYCQVPAWAESLRPPGDNYYGTGWGSIYRQKALAYDGLPKRGGVIRVGLTGGMPTLNPFQPADAGSEWLMLQIYDTLIEADLLGFKPGLAEKYEIGDGYTIFTFKLRTWSFRGGGPITARDAASSINKRRALAAEFGRPFPPVASVRAVDERTLEIRLSRPDKGFLERLTGLDGVVLAESVTSETEWELAVSAGTGPFAPAANLSGNRLRLEPNPVYWESAGDGQTYPLVGALEIFFVPESSAMEETGFDLAGPGPYGWRFNSRIRHVYYDAAGRLSRLKWAWPTD